MTTNQPLGLAQIGADLGDVTETIQFDLGTQITGEDGNRFVYVKAGEALALSNALCITPAFLAVKATKTLVDLGRVIAAVPPLNTGISSITDAYYFWAQVSGVSHVNCITGSTSSVSPVYTSATAGALGTASGSQSLIRGIYFTTANSSGATASRQAVLNNPQAAAF
jgi:hypothetical protein